MNKFFLMLFLLTSLPLAAVNENNKKPKTFFERSVLLAKGLGVGSVSLASIAWIYLKMPEAYKIMFVDTDEERRIEARKIMEEDGLGFLTDDQLGLTTKKRPSLLVRGSYFSTYLALFAAIGYSNVKYVLPKAYGYIKQALSS